MAAYKNVHIESKGRALKDLSALMDTVGKRSQPGGKITPGDVESVNVSRKPTQGSKNFKATGKGSAGVAHSATPMHKEWPAPKPPADEEDPMHEASEDSKMEAEEHAEGQLEGQEFMGDRANPTDSTVGDAKQVDAALKSYLVKGKKHKSRY